MEERRSNGFRVKPSFGQVLGYIQEGEPLTLDLPNHKASIYTSSHFYLDDYPNAPEPVSETPLPHTSLNPAAAFETADEGYSGTPFPRPPREFTRPSFLPDSDDGGMDPGQALRNDGLNPPRPPTLGGRLRESGIQAAETVVAGAAAGAAAATRSVTENQTTLALRGGGDWLDRTLRIPRRPPGWHHRRTKCRPRKSSGGPQKWSPCWRGRGNGRWRWNGKPPRTSRASLPEAEASEGFATAAEAAAGAAEAAAAAEAGGGALALLGEGALATVGAVGAATGGLAVAGAGAALVGTAWAIEGGLNAASHLMGWGAATGGGTDSDASRPSMTTDVQTLNGTQESGAVDHYFIQEQRRAQRPEVFRIDTESESEPRNRQIRSRPARRPRPQAQTPFGLNNVPIPVSSGSERSRVSRQSRGDRGPLGTQPSFEALRQASEPEAA